MNILEAILQSGGSLTIDKIVLNLGVTLLISVYMFLVYKVTFSGVVYNRNFNVTIVLITMITSFVMMIIGNNLALSLGMVGALSIVRFRSAIKDPRDIGFLFWGIAIGLSAGTGMYLISAISSLVIGITLIGFTFVKYKDRCMLLIIRGSADMAAVETELETANVKFRLRMRNLSGEFSEAIYEIKTTSGKENSIVPVISAVEGVSSVNLVTNDDELAV